MISNRELKRIGTRCKQTSDGPWKYIQVHSEFGFCTRHGLQAAHGGSVVLFSHPITNIKKSYNENFLASSRTDIPKLLEEIKRLKKKNKKQK